jgi:hypothetical protein
MKRKNSVVKPADYIFRFFEEIARQLEGDEGRYSDEWRKIPPEKLESEIFSHFERYWVEFSRDGIPLPWAQIAGLALVGWIRRNYPKSYVDPD